MNKGKLFMFASVALLSACTADFEPNAQICEDAAVAQKIVNTSVEAVEGELIIVVDTDVVKMLDGAESLTRSGVSGLDAVAEEIGAYSVEHVFNMNGNKERIKEHGLDRWFLVRFSENINLESAAIKLASVDAIDAVEFNTRVARPKVAPVEVDEEQMAKTRAGIYPFDDMMLDAQWHYHNTGNKSVSQTALAGADINLFPAWEITAGRKEIVVAVVDEGVDYTHPDLNANMWYNEAEINGSAGVDDDQNGYVDDIYGYNFAGDGPVSWDAPKDLGHGTHVAGTIAAVNNNGKGVAGVAGGTGNNDGVRIMSCQIFDGDDYGTVPEIAKAIQYAADNGACVMNNSWGMPVGGLRDDDDYAYGSYSAVRKAVDYFTSASNSSVMDGNIAIFAAGNEGFASAAYPGAYNEYICVTAFAPDGLPAYYTNYDRGCNLSAPGGECNNGPNDPAQVLSTMPNGKYGYAQGTSMACPHVSGIAALALSYALDNNIHLTLEQLKGFLVTSVNDMNARLMGTRNYYGGVMNLSNYKDNMGTGMIDAYQVLMAVRGTLCLPVTVGEEAKIDVDSYLGDGNLSIKMLSEIEISDDVREELGIETDPKVKGERLYITCTKPGSGIIKLHFVAGDVSVGGGSMIGGMEFTREFAIISRPNNSTASGWL